MSTTTIQVLLFTLFVWAVISAELWYAVRIIRKREPISVISAMNAEIAVMSARQRESENQQAASHKQIMRLESLVMELDRGVKILLAQLTELNEAPDYEQAIAAVSDIVSDAATDAGSARDRAHIQRQMARAFTIEEMDDLALELGIDDVSGATKLERARFIIQHMSNRKELGDLLAMIKGLRPNETW